jgi:hypothetical protein
MNKLLFKGHFQKETSFLSNKPRSLLMCRGEGLDGSAAAAAAHGLEAVGREME